MGTHPPWPHRVETPEKAVLAHAANVGPGHPKRSSRSGRMSRPPRIATQCERFVNLLLEDKMNGSTAFRFPRYLHFTVAHPPSFPVREKDRTTLYPYG